MSDLVAVSRLLADAVERRPIPSAAFVYNPLRYAREPHEQYLERFGRRGATCLLVGMNPGPFGMAQTGVPFGDVPSVRDWMGIRGHVGRPAAEHPKRPVEGFGLRRREGSGKRLWGWAGARFGPPEAFFDRFFVHNYCPLLFLHESGRNVTPDKLTADEREPLFEACDDALRAVVAVLRPTLVIGVGRFAEDRAVQALGPSGPRIGRILHPSPASPLANADWPGQAEAALRALGAPLLPGP